MKGNNMKYISLLLIVSVQVHFVYAQDAATETKSETAAQANPVEAKPASAPEASFTIGGVNLSIQDAINVVLEKNFTLQSAKYDVIMSDTNAKKGEKKYAPIVSAEGKYLEYTNPFSGANAFAGQKGYQFDTTLQVSKLFSTGTLLSGGVKNTLSDANDPALMFGGQILKVADPSFNRPGIFFGLQQELAKNSFGYADRSQDKILAKQAQGQREYTINLLSGLVVQALVDYWQVTIQKSALDNARKEEASNRQVRGMIARNVTFGLAENYDLNNYNARVAASQAKVAMSEQNLINATRKLLRTVNMPPDTKIEGITNLVEELPVLDQNDALKAAMAKRIDLRNAKLELDIAQLQQDMYDNLALPSVSATFNMTTQGQNHVLATAIGSAASLDYPQWSAGLKVTYPLWDQEIKTNQRNASFAIKQARIKLQNIEQEIRDDVLTRLENVKLAHGILATNRTARKESEAYYNRMLARSRTGKLNYQQVGMALENMVASRQRELESLVSYNISLLQFDLAKNEIFERYKVDVQKVLEKVK